MNRMEQKIQQIALKTFEEIAFMFFIPGIDEKYKNTLPSCITKVEFTGHFKGELLLFVYGENFLPSLASNMLGEDNIHSKQQQVDAIGEITNIICGNILPVIADPKEIFYLDAPKFIEKIEQNSNNKTLFNLKFELDQGVVEIIMRQSDKATE